MPLDVRHPFTRASALDAGISDARLESIEFCRVFHGVYVHRSTGVTPLVRVAAALLVHPDTAYASHLSAARVYGLPIPAGAEEHVSVRHRRDRRRTRQFRHHLAPAGPEIRLVHGLRVSAPAQLFCELGELLGLVDLVVAGDALVRWHGATPDALIRAAEVRGCTRTIRAARLVRAEVDSPMETKVRLLIVLAGLPEPQVNVKIRWPDGAVRYRFDLAYPEFKVAIEYDGRQHRADLDQWDHDISRRDWMDGAGWALVPVVARGVYRRPDETLERVRVALVRAGCSGLPRRLSEEWRAHFPVIR
jgi:very-short-patch-repair endonuclease